MNFSNKRFSSNIYSIDFESTFAFRTKWLWLNYSMKASDFDGEGAKSKTELILQIEKEKKGKSWNVKETPQFIRTFSLSLIEEGTRKSAEELLSRHQNAKLKCFQVRLSFQRFAEPRFDLMAKEVSNHYLKIKDKCSHRFQVPLPDDATWIIQEKQFFFMISSSVQRQQQSIWKYSVA